MDVLVADRYRLTRRIGGGGMGEVWAGSDRRLDRPVAVKLLRPELGSDPQIVRRVGGEARAAGRLVHPNVVSVYDGGTFQGLPYLVMELLPGRTVADELADGALPEDRVRDLARDVLSALAAAHAEGILHRDVKPGNILLTADGRAKVADFGIAKHPDAGVTETVQVLGTAAYMAPERLEGRQATARSDLYSVGVVLYQALTGRLPFPAKSPAGFLDALHRGARPAVRDLRPDLDPSLADAVERALSPDPARRFASAKEMAAALDAPAMGDGDMTGGPSVAPASPTGALPGPPAGPSPARHRRWRGLALLAMAVAAFVAAYLAVSSLRAPTPAPRPPAGGAADNSGPSRGVISLTARL